MNPPLLSALVLVGMTGILPAQTPVASDALLPSGDSPARPDSTAVPEPAAPAVTAPPRLSVMETTVTIDGVSRPDLAQSIADTIAAKLIESKEFEVVDMAFTTAKKRRMPFDSGSIGSPLPLISPDGTAESAIVGPEFLVIPTIVSEQGTFRLTLRKQHAETGRIETVLRDSVKGDTASLYAMVEKTAAKLIPARPPKPRYAYIKMWLSPGPEIKPVAVTPPPKAIPANLPAAKLAAIEAAKIQADRLAAITSEPERAGIIKAVNSQWSFAVVNGLHADEVKEGDLLMTWSERNPGQVHTLKVSTVNRTGVVVDTPSAALIQPGDRVYRWKTPVEIRPAP